MHLRRGHNENMADEHDPPAGPGKWRERDEEHRANKQQGDPDALAVENDPRGGSQSDAYRHARPTEMVTEGGTTMMGPGGAPPRDRSREGADGDDADVK